MSSHPISLRRVALAAAAAVLLTAAACGTSKDTIARTGSSGAPEASVAPTVKIASPANGATIGGNVIDLQIVATGITIVKPDGDTSGKTGHFHIFIDRPAVAEGEVVPKEAGIIHSPSAKVRVAGLAVGHHTITVVLGNGAHHRLVGVAPATLDVDVTGPSVQVNAPATINAGDVLPLDITVAGITIVKADGDTSGTTGHFHVFIDRDPAAPGAVIPKEDTIIHSAESHIEVPNLAVGEHTLWVVIGDGAHTALNPPVMAKVVVTVK